VKRAVVMKVNYHHHTMSLQPIGILSGTDFDTCMHTCPAENPSAGPPPIPEIREAEATAKSPRVSPLKTGALPHA
jgi:hypothetical protein